MGASTPLAPEDLVFWYADRPRQRTAMALLMLLDRAPDRARLRAAAARAVAAVPRLRQRVVEAPLDLALPRWCDDPTFDLDFHVRRYALPAPAAGESDLDALFRTVGPIYERPFDRSRPLWELVELERPEGGAAAFFRLHHAVADGVGGNTIVAALTDAGRAGAPAAPEPDAPPGAWDEPGLAASLLGAVRARVADDAARASAVARAAGALLRDPRAGLRAAEIAGSLLADASYRSRSPLRAFGRARRLAGLELPLEPLREAKARLGGRMVDVLCTGVAGAMGAWLEKRGAADVRELLTLVPINLRPLGEQRGAEAGVGNRASGILVRLPVAPAAPEERFREVQRRLEARRRHPAAAAMPELAALLSVLPRRVFQALSLATSQSVELIVTNVPGIRDARCLAGAEITAAYPFAPVAPRSPVSVALYGYRDRIFVGIDADGTSMPDVAEFRGQLARSFERLVRGARPRRSGRPRPRAARRGRATP